MPVFNHAKIKGIKSDFVKGEIAISFVVDFDKNNAELARDLSRYADTDVGAVEITIVPRQISLFDKPPKVEETATMVDEEEIEDVLPLMEEDVEDDFVLESDEEWEEA